MEYTINYSWNSPHILHVTYKVDNVNVELLEVALSKWRPGRYEFGNFAKNIRTFEVYSNEGKSLNFSKLSSHSWGIQTMGSSEVEIRYTCYAADINAGSSFVNNELFYINGINCLLYVPSRMYEPCVVNCSLPSDFKVGTGLNKVDWVNDYSKKNENVVRTFGANNFHQLVDSPILAAKDLKCETYKSGDTQFYLWFQGIVNPHWKKLIADFKRFSDSQIKDFGDFPVEEYHFLFLILPYSTYHGVEHVNSTVITLGPSYKVMDRSSMYLELLGVSSHELYHTWNVKQIRPKEMCPYDYSKENYTYMGYLTEGVTTYFGDKYLLKSGVFSWEEYVKTFDKLLDRHFNNFGVLNMSVADSSFDTWLDGYVRGIPHRKSSIYVEGALLAFLTDVFILKNSDNEFGLEDVMKDLYQNTAKHGKGVTEEAYKSLIEHYSGKSFDDYWNNLFYGTGDYFPYLSQSLAYIGCDIVVSPAKKTEEAYLGVKVKYQDRRCLVDMIHEKSPLKEFGLAEGDEIISINDVQINQDLTQWLNFFNEETMGNVDRSMTLCYKRSHGRLQSLDYGFSLNKEKGNDFYRNFRMKQLSKVSDKQRQAYKKWES